MTTSSPDLRNLHSQFVDHLMKIVRLTGAAAAETARLPRTIDLMEAVDALKKSQGKPTDPDSIAEAKRVLPLLEAERAQGFPLFHGLAAIGIWSTLEAFIEDLLLGCMMRDAAFADVENVRRLKVPLLEFEGMTTEARKQWIIESLESALGVSRKPGAGKFEPVLGAFGLGGPVDDECRACLVELSAVRNVLAHRNGRADARFISTCPWLDLCSGDEVLVNQRMLTAYGTAAIAYGTGVYRRALVRFGEPTEREDTFLSSLPVVHRTSKRARGGAA
jgi:hypothetical protein